MAYCHRSLQHITTYYNHLRPWVFHQQFLQSFTFPSSVLLGSRTVHRHVYGLQESREGSESGWRIGTVHSEKCCWSNPNTGWLSWLVLVYSCVSENCIKSCDSPKSRMQGHSCQVGPCPLSLSNEKLSITTRKIGLNGAILMPENSRATERHVREIRPRLCPFGGILTSIHSSTWKPRVSCSSSLLSHSYIIL
jgi:hypothetical protein